MGVLKDLSHKAKIQIVKNAALIVLGSLIIAVSTGMFLVPGNIINGGLSGIAIILKAVWQIPVDITVGVLSVFLFILGWIILGKKFSLNTLISTIVYPIALSIILRVIPENPIGFDSANEMHLLLAAIFGGALLGLGVALTFLAGGSTGGVDVLYFIFKKYFDIKQSISSFTIDAIIIGSGMFAIGIIPGFYGIISAFISAMVIEMVFIGLSSSFLGTIISTKSDDINQFILQDLERGSTIVPVKGGYGGADYKMIQVAFDRKELAKLKEFIAEVDPKAFAIFTNVKSINGYGFEPFPQRLNGRNRKKPKNGPEVST
ncbi:MAG: YitT family protein [Bacilli bacterium]